MRRNRSHSRRRIRRPAVSSSPGGTPPPAVVGLGIIDPRHTSSPSCVCRHGVGHGRYTLPFAVVGLGIPGQHLLSYMEYSAATTPVVRACASRPCHAPERGTPWSGRRGCVVLPGKSLGVRPKPSILAPLRQDRSPRAGTSGRPRQRRPTHSSR